MSEEAIGEFKEFKYLRFNFNSKNTTKYHMRDRLIKSVLMCGVEVWDWNERLQEISSEKKQKETT